MEKDPAVLFSNQKIRPKIELNSISSAIDFLIEVNKSKLLIDTGQIYKKKKRDIIGLLRTNEKKFEIEIELRRFFEDQKKTNWEISQRLADSW